MCSLDLEPCEVWKEWTPTARKRHDCDGCGREILPGTVYLRHTHIFEGDPGREAMCPDCWLVRESFAEAHGQSFLPSMLIDQLRECIDEDGRESEWRVELASVLKRYRLSRCYRESLAMRREAMAARNE